MPNQFDIAVPDALGTIASYRQEVGRAALLEAQARRESALAATAPEEQRIALQRKALDNKKLDLANMAEERGLAGDEEFQRTLREIDPSLPVVEKLGAIATNALKVGRFGEAEKSIKILDSIANHESLRDAREERGENAKVAAGAKRLDRIISLMQGMTDPTTKVLMEDLYRQEFGQEAPTVKFPYSDNLRKAAVAAAERAKGEGATAAEAALTAQRLAAIERADKVASAQVEYYNARIDDVKTREKRGVKEGGKAAAVTKSEMTHAEVKLKAAYPGLNKAERDLAAMEIAADAKAIQRQESGSYADAIDKALDARRGQFLQIPEKYFGFRDKDKARPTYIPKPIADAMRKNNDAVADVDIGGVKSRIVNPTATKPPVPPKPGDVYKGYRFKGGVPGDKNNWEKV